VKLFPLTVIVIVVPCAPLVGARLDTVSVAVDVDGLDGELEHPAMMKSAAVKTISALRRNMNDSTPLMLFTPIVEFRRRGSLERFRSVAL
jgi:hypothetical protein